MNDRQNYQSLVDSYKWGMQFIKKLGTSGMFLQIGILGFINGWKHLEIPYYKAVAPVLFSLSIYFFIKDFLTIRKIEETVSQMILDGIIVEKKNGSFGNFFQDILQHFNLAQLLLQRSLINAIAFWCLGYLLSLFIIEIQPSFVISQGSLLLFAGVLAALTSKLYYNSFRNLAETKGQAFAK